jgi:RNA polymerase sigma factor (sigma-70 family)
VNPTAPTTSTTRRPTTSELATLTRVARRIARGARLGHEDAQDFEQSVHLRALERKYDIFTQFDGRSSLATYLGVVVRRMLLDWRNRVSGKWRPSVAARRLGHNAVKLEQLIFRDGLTTREAIAIVQNQSDEASCDLERLLERLPPRVPRRLVSVPTLDELPAGDGEHPLEVAEREAAEQRRRRALAEALRKLPPGDRSLINARYMQGRSVRTVAASLKADTRLLYRRFDRLIQTLRDHIEGDARRRPGD